MNTAVAYPGLQAPQGPGLLTHLRDLPHYKDIVKLWLIRIISCYLVDSGDIHLFYSSYEVSNLADQDRQCRLSPCQKLPFRLAFPKGK